MIPRFLRSSWPAVVLAAAGILVVLLRYDTPVADIAVFAAYVLIGIAFPGVFTWRLLLRRLHANPKRPITWFEDLSLGSIFGFGLQLPVYIVGVSIGFPYLVVLLPLVAAVLSALPFGRRIWRLPTARIDPRASWALAATTVYGVGWLGYHAFQHRPLGLPANRAPGLDESFHEALVGELSHRFPPEIPFVLGTPLDYHWFVHAQTATAQWMTGIDSVILLRQLLPAAMLVLSVCGLAAVALRLTRRPAVSVIAPALLLIGGFHLFGPHFDGRTFFDAFLSMRYISSPSQAYGVMMSMPALLLILEVLRGRSKTSVGAWIALVLALLALSGSKATFLPIFVCGAIAAWVFLLLKDRRIDRSVSILVGLLIAVSLFAQYVLFGGQSGSLSLYPFRTVEKALLDQGLGTSTGLMVAMTLSLLIGWLLMGVGAVGLIKKGRWKDPRVFWLVTAIAAGTTVPFLLFRSGLSQLWFQRSVVELVALLSVWGLAYLLPRPLTRSQALTWGGVAAVTGLVVYGASSLIEAVTDPGGYATRFSLLLTVLTPFVVVGVWAVVRFTAGRLRKPKPSVLLLVVILLAMPLSSVYATVVDVVTDPHTEGRVYPKVFSAGGVPAAKFIRDNGDPYDVIATNMHCNQPGENGRCDNRHFWLSAYAERRVLVEGWGYTAATNAQGVKDALNRYIEFSDPERLAINDAAFNFPSEVTVGRLVDTYDVDWLFVSKDYPADVPGLNALTSMLTQRYENANYVVYEVIQ